MWNRLRYTLWAPAYDAIARAGGFDAARRLSIDRLQLGPGDRVLLAGAGTGLDLEFLPAAVDVTAIDVTPAMLSQLERRAADAGRTVTTRILDARELPFPDSSFDAAAAALLMRGFVLPGSPPISFSFRGSPIVAKTDAPMMV